MWGGDGEMKETRRGRGGKEERLGKTNDGRNKMRK